MGVLLERNLHYALVVRKYGFVAVAKVEAPDLDIFIGGTGHNELGVV